MVWKAPNTSLAALRPPRCRGRYRCFCNHTATCLTCLRTVLPGLPYVFGGHCPSCIGPKKWMSLDGCIGWVSSPQTPHYRAALNHASEATSFLCTAVQAQCGLRSWIRTSVIPVPQTGAITRLGDAEVDGEESQNWLSFDWFRGLQASTASGFLPGVANSQMPSAHSRPKTMKPKLSHLRPSPTWCATKNSLVPMR